MGFLDYKSTLLCWLSFKTSVLKAGKPWLLQGNFTEDGGTFLYSPIGTVILFFFPSIKLKDISEQKYSFPLSGGAHV